LTANPSSALANGTAPISLALLVRNGLQMPLGGLPVEWSSSGSNNLFSSDAGTTDPAGVTTTILRSTRAEQKTVTARIGSWTMTKTVEFLAGPPIAATSSIIVSPNPGMVAGGPSTLTVAVALGDALGNPVSGAPVSLSATGSQMVFSPPSGVTNMAGVFTALLDSPIIQRQTVTATSGSVVLRTNASWVCPNAPRYVTLPPVSTGGTGSRCVASGDIDGDGRKDLVVGNASSSNVSVLLGNGQGGMTLAGRSNLSMASASSAVLAIAVRDLNRDGRDDVLTANWFWGTFDSFLSQPDGGLSAPLARGSGGFSSGLAFGDFDGDGRDDLFIAVGGAQYNATTAFRGLVDGGFDYVGGVTATNSNGVAGGDLNGDGLADMAIAQNTTAHLGIALSRGDGGFTVPVTYGGCAGSGANFVTEADVDRDGRLDVITAETPCNTVTVYLGNGDGTLRATVPVIVGTGPNGLTTLDANGDGLVDVATVSGSRGISLLFGRGDGGFSAPFSFDAGPASNSITVNDFNGDGLPDLATASNSNEVSVLLQSGCQP